MNIFISPTEKVRWKISIDDLIILLKKIYPNINISKIENINRKYSYEWEYQKDNYYLNGRISNDFNTIVFETNNFSLSRSFILGVRSLMPIDEYILIYDESFTLNSPLSSNNWVDVEKLFSK